MRSSHEDTRHTEPGSERNIRRRHSEPEKRAGDCVNALYQIESQVFEVEIADGAIVPKKTWYWQKSGVAHAEVFLRLSD